MKDARVKDWMSKSPILINPDAKLPDAHDLMKKNSVRRLPVLKDGKLLGIVTRGDVREAGPSDANTLSIFELNYKLAKLPISDIMTRDPITVTQNTKLSEAANLMLNHKIGGLPVMEGDQLVGIITESDIFRAFVKLIQD